MRIRNLAVWTAVLCLSGAGALEAQPGGRRGGMSGGMGFGVSPERVFSLLAFEEKLNVSDKQLIAVREVLKPLYVEQRRMMAEMLGGARGPGARDFQAIREQFQERQNKMRDKIMDALATALTRKQIEYLTAHLVGAVPGRGGAARGGPQGGGF